ncbi:hypothetical protein CAC42_4219 [Sphaceloma murrayae]|uniref:Uncharacterized protein n=1 Tax=Sphaceloma murrayae TaxID=2082308 RepID=A0A2K1QKV0_9PEZI|nr:hypothetical protein CAC42_4219 [Sphaceloma murrayae]
MADQTHHLPPNLADILSTLSKFAPPPAEQPSNEPDDDEYDPAAYLQETHTYGVAHPSIPNGTLQPSRQPAGPVVDPATITEWSAGLRCISKIAAQNPNFAPAIKRMISNQRKNEMDWYAKRQELKREQAQRGSTLNELNSIMKSIGAASAQPSHQPRSEEELRAELLAFDTKIHRAQVHMINAMTAELKALGVPFFGTRSDVLLERGGAADDTLKIPAKISSEDLRGLQQRMITYLEDMYKD